MAHDVQTSRGRTTPTRTIKPPVKAAASRIAPKAPAKAKAAPALDPTAVLVANVVRGMSSEQVFDLFVALFPTLSSEELEDLADNFIGELALAEPGPRRTLADVMARVAGSGRS